MHVTSSVPEFLRDQTVGSLPPLHRVLFLGLLALVDADGLVDDLPDRIRIEVLPYDACNVDAMLNDLEREGLITRDTVENYGEDGEPYTDETITVHNHEYWFGRRIRISLTNASPR